MTATSDAEKVVQSWTKKILSHFRTVSPHQKWRRTKLLSPKVGVWVASQVAELFKENVKKVTEMLWTDGKYPTDYMKVKFSRLC